MNRPDLSTVDFEHCVWFYQQRADSQTNPQVARWLQEHPEVARRAQRQAAAQTHLQHRYDAVLDEPIPRRLLSGPGKTYSRRLVPIAVPAILALAIGSTWWLQGARQAPLTIPSSAPGTIDMTVQYQPTIADATTIPVPDLTDHGYHLTGTHTMQTSRAPVLEFVYTNKHGARVSIYAQAQQQQFASSAQDTQSGELASVHWRNHGVDYMLIGAIPERSLQTLAQSLTTEPPHALSPQRPVGMRQVKPQPQSQPASSQNPRKVITPVARGTEARDT